MMNDADTRSGVFNDANVLRAHEIVQDMEHETQRKRKEETLRDTGVHGKGVVDGRQKKVKGIPSTSETALKNVSKFLKILYDSMYRF